MEQSTNEIMYNLATALILDLLVNNKITQAEFERHRCAEQGKFRGGLSVVMCCAAAGGSSEKMSVICGIVLDYLPTLFNI